MNQFDPNPPSGEKWEQMEREIEELMSDLVRDRLLGTAYIVGLTANNGTPDDERAVLAHCYYTMWLVLTKVLLTQYYTAEDMQDEIGKLAEVWHPGSLDDTGDDPND